MTVNSAVNFIVYCIVSRQLRSDLINMFRCSPRGRSSTSNRRIVASELRRHPGGSPRRRHLQQLQCLRAVESPTCQQPPQQPEAEGDDRQSDSAATETARLSFRSGGSSVNRRNDDDNENVAIDFGDDNNDDRAAAAAGVNYDVTEL